MQWHTDPFLQEDFGQSVSQITRYYTEPALRTRAQYDDDPLIAIGLAAAPHNEYCPSEPLAVIVPVEIEEKVTKVSQIREKETVLVLHVAVHNSMVLGGEELLQSVLQAGLQFGEMNIFYCYLNPAGSGPVLFSLANIVTICLTSRLPASLCS